MLWAVAHVYGMFIRTVEDILDGLSSAFNRWPWLWVPLAYLAALEFVLVLYAMAGSP